MTSPKPFRRSDALSSGLSDSEIRRALRTGELERLAPGIYLDGPTAEGLGDRTTSNPGANHGGGTA